MFLQQNHYYDDKEHLTRYDDNDDEDDMVIRTKTTTMKTKGSFGCCRSSYPIGLSRILRMPPSVRYFYCSIATISIIICFAQCCEAEFNIRRRRQERQQADRSYQLRFEDPMKATLILEEDTFLVFEGEEEREPSQAPLSPSSSPPISIMPTKTLISSPHPTIHPSPIPSILSPNDPSIEPTFTLSNGPSIEPTFTLSNGPSIEPTFTLSNNPSIEPTFTLSNGPSIEPTFTLSNGPSIEPTFTLSNDPSIEPTFTLSNGPSIEPTFTLSNEPSIEPTFTLSNGPSIEPTFTLSNGPSTSIEPTLHTSTTPSKVPSNQPSIQSATASPIQLFPSGNTTLNIFNPTSRSYFNYNPNDVNYGPGRPKENIFFYNTTEAKVITLVLTTEETKIEWKINSITNSTTNITSLNNTTVTTTSYVNQTYDTIVNQTILKSIPYSEYEGNSWTNVKDSTEHQYWNEFGMNRTLVNRCNSSPRRTQSPIDLCETHINTECLEHHQIRNRVSDHS